MPERRPANRGPAREPVDSPTGQVYNWRVPSGEGGNAMAGTDVSTVGAAPLDSDTVRLAMRLGWYLAELRGRYWWQGPRPKVKELPVDPPHALPLRSERSPAESRAQCCETVAALAAYLGVDRPYDADGLHEARPFAQRIGGAGQQLLARLRQDAYSDLVGVAITCIPDRPSGSRLETERRKRAAVARRGLTPSTPLPDVPR